MKRKRSEESVGERPSVLPVTPVKTPKTSRTATSQWDQYKAIHSNLLMYMLIGDVEKFKKEVAFLKQGKERSDILHILNNMLYNAVKNKFNQKIIDLLAQDSEVVNVVDQDGKNLALQAANSAFEQLANIGPGPYDDFVALINPLVLEELEVLERVMALPNLDLTRPDYVIKDFGPGYIEGKGGNIVYYLEQIRLKAREYNIVGGEEIIMKICIRHWKKPELKSLMQPLIERLEPYILERVSNYTASLMAELFAVKPQSEADLSRNYGQNSQLFKNWKIFIVKDDSAAWVNKIITTIGNKINEMSQNENLNIGFNLSKNKDICLEGAQILALSLLEFEPNAHANIRYLYKQLSSFITTCVGQYTPKPVMGPWVTQVTEDRLRSNTDVPGQEQTCHGK